MHCKELNNVDNRYLSGWSRFLSQPNTTWNVWAGQENIEHFFTGQDFSEDVSAIWYLWKKPSNSRVYKEFDLTCQFDSYYVSAESEGRS